MTHFPMTLMLAACLAQNPDAPLPPAETPQAEIEAKPAETGAKPTTESTETEAERIVREAADKVDAIDYVSAKVRQTIRAGGTPIVSQGEYRRGPNFRSRFELDVDLGKSSAKRVHACDGKTGVVYEKMLDNETIESFQVDQVMPLFENRDLPPEYRRQLLLRMPFVKPGDMLRGYLETIHFDKVTETQLGEKDPRPAWLVEGAWREEVVPAIAHNSNIHKPEDLSGGTPQYARLYIDKETGFPLRIELFRRDTSAEYKPILTLEFLEVSNEKLADDVFTFVPPEKVRAVDVTTTLVAQLNQFPEKAKPAPTDAPKKQQVAQPLAPTGSK